MRGLIVATWSEEETIPEFLDRTQVRSSIHGLDIAAIEFHDGSTFFLHRHTIYDTLPHDKKQALAAHIDRCHRSL